MENEFDWRRKVRKEMQMKSVVLARKKGKTVAAASSSEGGRSRSIVNADAPTISADEIKAKIYTIRGVQVMLDRDLASLYGVLTKNLNKAVKRNLERFPEDFMFRLTKEEGLRFQNGTSNAGDEVLAIDSATGAGFLRFQNGTLDKGDGASADDLNVLRFQSGTLKLGQGKHFKYQPYAFTENGIAMLSSVLHCRTRHSLRRKFFITGRCSMRRCLRRSIS